MTESQLKHAKKERTLTAAAFEQLLASLGPDRELAAEKYEELRKALWTFFEYRGSRNPAEETDETFNRVARRLSEGQSIFADNPASYFYAVARNVWRERLARPSVEISLEESGLQGGHATPSPEELWVAAEQRAWHERRLNCLEKSLQQLAPADQELIRGYYFGEGRSKIEARQALAARLGIAPNALRIRACRLRDKLELWVAECLHRTRK
jgi:DNA-directed RNA polymerase specialized sigma24 family protein